MKNVAFNTSIEHAFKVKNHTKLSFKKLFIPMNLVRDFSPLFDLSDFLMNSQLILLTGKSHSGMQQFERFWPCMYGPLGSH